MNEETKAAGPVDTPDPDKTFNAFYFLTGDRVKKIGGDYTLTGTVVAAFQKRNGTIRYVVEADVPEGLLHIFKSQNLQLFSNP